MPESGHIRPHVLKRLEELKKTGGKVVQSAPVPLQSLQELRVAPILSEATCGLRWKARQLDDGMLFFLANFKVAGRFEAKLRVTGKEFETLWMPPFVLDVTEAVKTGDNKLKVLVTSTSQGKPKLGDVKLRTVSNVRLDAGVLAKRQRQ